MQAVEIGRVINDKSCLDVGETAADAVDGVPLLALGVIVDHSVSPLSGMNYWRWARVLPTMAYNCAYSLEFASFNVDQTVIRMIRRRMQR